MKHLSIALISLLMSPNMFAAPLFQTEDEHLFLNQKKRQKAQKQQVKPVAPDVRITLLCRSSPASLPVRMAIRFGLDSVCGINNKLSIKDPNDPTRLTYIELDLVIKHGQLVWN